jgi:hypothetical protein
VVTRQLRFWQRLAGALAMISLMTLPFGVGIAASPDYDTLRMLLDHLLITPSQFSVDGKPGAEIHLHGANLHIENGSGHTDQTPTNGLGNMIIGYNEERNVNDPDLITAGRAFNVRSGSHNLVVGKELNYSSYGGLVVGLQNTISGRFASVSGGQASEARGSASSVSGGSENKATGPASSITGGAVNEASGALSAITAGRMNQAQGGNSWVGGGYKNISTDDYSVVLGGSFNHSGGQFTVK